MARLIAIDGLDGSGKGTQAALLKDYLAQTGRAARLLSFPTYQEPASSLVNLYLAGGWATRPVIQAPTRPRPFSPATDMFPFAPTGAPTMKSRTVSSLPTATPPPTPYTSLSKLPKEQWDDFLAWLWDFEFEKLSLPRA